MGHAICAYLGLYTHKDYIYEAIDDINIQSIVQTQIMMFKGLPPACILLRIPAARLGTIYFKILTPTAVAIMSASAIACAAGEIPDIKNMVPYEPFDFYIKRKLYVHNMGHAICAYLGLYTHKDYIQADVFVKPVLFRFRQLRPDKLCQKLIIRYYDPE